jgi:hypothetical protein
VLFLAQGFYKANVMSWDEELAIYETVCSQLVANGITVLFKDHPRAERPFLSFLSEKDPRIGDVPGIGSSSWPIELIAASIMPGACVAGTSTSLFTLRAIFHMPTYTFVHLIAPRLKARRLHSEVANAKLVSRYATSVAELVTGSRVTTGA